MRQYVKLLLFAVLLCTSAIVSAQYSISGVVVSADKNALPGASVQIKGTSTGTITDQNGQFTLPSNRKSGTLLVSFIGYSQKAIDFSIMGTSIDLGTISLEYGDQQLDVIVVNGSGIIDLAEDRKTPIAVSTIPAKEIQAKVGTFDVTTALVNTPSVYVAGQAGGYGDSEIRVRGFDQSNTAFLINGQPINGMEDGNMYWSNWSGISDIASAIQIQRGLGSSKLAISSVGGTVNFITKTTNREQGGFVSGSMANDSYYKGTVMYNSGMSSKGWGFSFMLSHWQGDGYNDGNKGQGQTYFLSVGYQPNEKHNFNFLITGAPQWHDQNYTKSIDKYLTYGRKYNNNWGTLDGDYLSLRRNYYHKPIFNLNWDWNINETSNLSTVLYASIGRGGGTGNLGSLYPVPSTDDGQIDWDSIEDTNLASENGAAEFIIRSSVNNHMWYGMVTNYEHIINENLTLNAGFDIRLYHGTHFRQVVNLLGANYYTDANSVQYGSRNISKTFDANPWQALSNYADESDRIGYDYDEKINYGGLFGQAEYAKDNYSFFIQGSISEQYYKRWDRYQYTKENEASDLLSHFGYNIKGGGSYSFSPAHQVYVNAGYYSRQPYHDNLFLNYANDVNPITKNEKVLGLELGYKFNSNYVDVEFNAYRTEWKDRVTTTTSTDDDGNEIFINNEGVSQVNSGIELNVFAHPITKLSVNGFLSVGDWKYQDDVVSTTRDQDLNVISRSVEELDGGKVGGAAQFTAGLGVKYYIIKGLSVDIDYRFYDNLYADVVAKDNIELPSYDLMDGGISYHWSLNDTGTRALNFRLNVNNIFDEVYLSELTSNNAVEDGDETYKGINTSNYGYFGMGRTGNFSIRFDF